MTRGTPSRGASAKPGTRTFIRRGIVLGVACALLLGPPGLRPASDAAPTVVRIGYVAQLTSLERPGVLHPADVATAAYLGLLGAREGAEEMNYTARLVGKRVEVLEAPAATPEDTVRMARLLLSRHVMALVGGFDPSTAEALSRVAAERGVVFLNVGATDDRLRNELCSRLTFHVEASDAMYLDAVADWFIRGLAFLVDENAPQGVQVIRRTPARRWFLVTDAGELWQARRARLEAALEERHWGGRVVGSVTVRGSAGLRQALAAIGRARPDLVVAMLPAAGQLEFYRLYARARLPFELTGFPEPLTQTREFFAELLREAPGPARGSIRFVSFEPTFQAVGGPELARRFFQHWHHTLDGPAWTSWLAIKMLWETFLHVAAPEGPALARYLESSRAVFDGYQGIGMTFRPWDHQLRHPLMASRLVGLSADPAALAQMVGQFPNVLAPGRDPNDVLDQLGETAHTTRCRWAMKAREHR